MSLLLIDAGNSRIKWRTVESNGHLNAVFYCPSSKIETFFNDLISHLKAQSGIHHCILVHVLGETFESVAVSKLKSFGIQPTVVDVSENKHGLDLAYLEPSAFGADRLIALLGARKCLPRQSLIVVDCGTAVTIDALSELDQHLGGLIMPGIPLWLGALQGGTQSKEMTVPELHHGRALAVTTAQAMASGALIGLAGAISKAISKIRSEAGWSAGSTPVLLTGGDGELLHPYWDEPIQYEADLIFHGLVNYFERVL